MNAIDALVARLRGESGFAADASDRARVLAQLAARARELGLPDADACARRALDDAREYALLEGALSPAETWLFRYPESFALVREHARRSGGRGVRVLLLGCGGWCEPASVAAALVEELPESARIEVIASDRNPAILAVEPRFRGLAVRGGVPPWAARHFVDEAGALVPAPRLRRTIEPVVGDARAVLARIGGEFDAIFIRNVVIYLSDAERVAILEAAAKRLAPDGLLFVGHAEVVAAARATGLAPVDAPGAFCLRKPGGAAPRAVADPRRAASRTDPPKVVDAGFERSIVEKSSVDKVRAEADGRDGGGDGGDADTEIGIDIEAQLSRGLALEAAGDTAGASQCARRVLYLDPAHEAGLLLSARLADARGDRAAAERFRARAMRAHLSGEE